ncbi:MAG: ApaG protein [Verrucomicrobiales bacterium]
MLLVPKFSKEFEELEGLSVKVDDVIYMPNLEAPKDRPHPFVYFISIINRSDQEVRIMGRKWVIQQENGEWIVVEGDGVVNQEPVIKPGDDFTYNSYHVIGDNSRATGSFFGETPNGMFVMVRIPDFDLRIPQWAEKS